MPGNIERLRRPRRQSSRRRQASPWRVVLVQVRPGRRPAPRPVADTGPEEGSRSPLLGAVQQYNARKTALAEEADFLKRVTLRPKMSHRGALIVVADTREKGWLSAVKGVEVLPVAVVSDRNLAHNRPSGLKCRNPEISARAEMMATTGAS